eukprot:TRINITY_DN14706_c0_g1_i1.p2 TRINITY_DN14706_c0_g1~~TRINITY_DN14706_c0_g1_i1.p2  ORF type:complete len:112 (+),score=2.37 TRINITY_DN14706_c0_g1_i1:308-643(+)
MGDLAQLISNTEILTSVVNSVEFACITYGAPHHSLWCRTLEKALETVLGTLEPDEQILYFQCVVQLAIRTVLQDPTYFSSAVVCDVAHLETLLRYFTQPSKQALDLSLIHI